MDLIMDEQDRNRRLVANIAAGRSPLDAEIEKTLHDTAAANLDIPGPRALQLLDELELHRASERIEPGAEQAHRDDLAREVSHYWRLHLAAGHSEFRTTAALREALDRLARAYTVGDD